MKLIKRCFILILILLTAGLLFFTLQNREQTVSEFENRTLAPLPALSSEAVWDGSLFRDWDAYLSDHVAWRDAMMRDYLWLQLRVKHQVLVNDLVLGREALLPYLGEKRLEPGEDARLGQAAAERLVPIRDAVEAYGGHFLFLGVEGQSVVFRDRYPSYIHTHVDYYQHLAAAFRTAAAEQGIEARYLIEQMGAHPEDYYSRVDHHYNFYGAYLAYETLCVWSEEQGLPVPLLSPETLKIAPLPNPFYGAYSRKLYGLSPVTEQLLGFDAACMPPYTRWDNGSRTDAPLLTLPQAGQPVSYAAYMGGDHGETVIKTNRPELPDLLIVGDSFTNPVEALCVGSFNEIRSLDFRYYHEMSLTDYLRDYPADLVVLIRDSLNYTGTEGNGDLH